MFFRVVLVMTAVFTVMQVNAAGPDLSSATKYQSVPPPPPGPYLSSGLSNITSGRASHAESNQQMVSGNRASPLIRPDVLQRGNNMGAPESAPRFAPNINSAAPSMNRMPPPMMYNQPDNIKPQADLSRPPFNPQPMYRQQAQPQMNQQPMYRQQVQPQMNQQPMYRQQVQPQMNQQPMYRQQVQPQMNPQPMYHRQQAQPQMNRQLMYQQQNQPPPVWGDFHIPMSNYPRQDMRAQPPFSR